ncbi:MAG TPA: hypothetical protein VFA07_06695 [Chthonomonadaceae bacterium]|nr:hypothetical protein [Chthonomonadaceae bacterium]
MRKEIHPASAFVIIMVALLLVLFLYYKKTEPPPTVPMNPLGPGGALMHRMGGDWTKVLTPAEKAMVKPSKKASSSPGPR